MRSLGGDSIEGMILGNSFVRFGYIEDKNIFPTINLAVPSQDLFYNSRVFDMCVTNYKQRMRNLKFIIIDLYDYNYFNGDISKGKGLYDYFMWGGIVEEHNYYEKHNIDFDDELFVKTQIIRNSEVIDHIMEMLFEDWCIVNDVINNTKRWTHIDAPFLIG